MPHRPFILELEDVGVDDAARALSDESGFVCLDARGAPPAIARYSVVAANPTGQFSMAGGFITVDGHTTIDSPHNALSRFCAKITEWNSDPYVPFNCGIIGYIGFEGARALRGLSPAQGFSRHPQCKLGIYGVAAVFDHMEGTAWVVANGDDYGEARRRAYRLHDTIVESASRNIDEPPSVNVSGVRMTPDEANFRKTLETARSWIRSDIVSRVHVVRHARAPFDDEGIVARFLSTTSPGVRALMGHEGAAFSFHSTDALVNVEGRRIRSMLAVHPSNAGMTDSAIRAIRDEIAGSLATLCEDGMVRCESTGPGEMGITGTLCRGLAPIDAVIGLIPSHATTGTPYDRAMELIGRSEDAHRSFYGGAFGTIDPIRCSFRTIESASVYADGTVGTTAGIDMDENSDVEDVAMRLCKSLLTT